MIQTAIFDLGNVFVRVEPERATSKLIELNANFDTSAFLRKLSKSEASIQFQLGQISPEDFYEAISQDFSVKISFEKFKEIYQEIFDPIQPMIDLLPELREKYTLVLLSNTDVLHIDYIARQYGFFHHFHHLLFSYDVQLVKPDAAIYHEALRLAGSPPENSVYIDDKWENVQAAIDMGMAGIPFNDFKSFQVQWKTVAGGGDE